MNYEEQLKLQSFLDGELPEKDARDVAARVARDKQAAALLAELRHTREAITGFEDAVRLPESREFYWSKIQREIDRLQPVTAREAPAFSLWAYLRRLAVPATALALVAIAGLVANRGLHGFGGAGVTEVSVSDAEALTYRDYAAGTTLVWLSFPADNEVAQNTTSGTLP
jgi:anti-sigma factor RsiW